MKNKKIADLLAFKTNLLEVLIIAVLLALGVNLFSSGVAGYFSISFINLIYWGILFLSLGLIMFLRNAHPINSGEYNFKGVVCIEDNTKNMLPIDGYHFTEKVSDYVKALCAENIAFQRIWDNESIGTNITYDGKKAIMLERPKANDLLIEAIEYYVLDFLAIHLSGHFTNNPLFSKENLDTLERENIPDILLKNRYIDMFSKPMEEREKFINCGVASFAGKVVSAFGNDGAIFQNFEMLLPKGSSITREKDHSINITTKRFRLKFRPIFTGFASVLPRNFEEIYMGKTFDSISTFGVGLKISVNYSLRTLLTSKGWEYYWWLDSFLGKLEESFSMDSFLSRISWYQNAAMYMMIENRGKTQPDNVSKNQAEI